MNLSNKHTYLTIILGALVMIVITGILLSSRSDFFKGSIQFFQPQPGVKKLILNKNVLRQRQIILNPYRIYPTTNQAQGFPLFDDEQNLNYVAVERSTVTVMIPEGYENLAKAHAGDLVRCKTRLEDFLGISFPADRIKFKIYISNDNSNRGFSFNNKLAFKRSQENIDIDLQLVNEHSPDDFLYNSSQNYCANTHELTHAFVSQSPITGWANEGLAEYSQKVNQPGSKDYMECQVNGVFRTNIWGASPNERVLFPYSDLSENIGANPSDGPLWYNTAMCFTQELYSEFGYRAMQNVIRELHRYSLDPNLFNPAGNERYQTNIYVEHILHPILGDRVYPILEKYGIEAQDFTAL